MFSQVSRLEVRRNLATLDDPKIPLVSFREISSTVKYLYLSSIALPCSQLFSLLHLFPLLEDPVIDCDYSLDAGDDPHGPQAVVPSTSPAFTGAPELWPGQG